MMTPRVGHSPRIGVRVRMSTVVKNRPLRLVRVDTGLRIVQALAPKQWGPALAGLGCQEGSHSPPRMGLLPSRACADEHFEQ